jgi:hypothetical protein
MTNHVRVLLVPCLAYSPTFENGGNVFHRNALRHISQDMTVHRHSHDHRTYWYEYGVSFIISVPVLCQVLCTKQESCMLIVVYMEPVQRLGSGLNGQGSIPGGARHFSVLDSAQTDSGAHLSNLYRGLFPSGSSGWPL